MFGLFLFVAPSKRRKFRVALRAEPTSMENTSPDFPTTVPITYGK